MKHTQYPYSPGQFTESISPERLLFDRIKKIKESGEGTVEVIIELYSEFINVLSKNPLKIEINGRNIFFRHANGHYIDHTDKLKQ